MLDEKYKGDEMRGGGGPTNFPINRSRFGCSIVANCIHFTSANLSVGKL